MWKRVENVRLLCSDYLVLCGKSEYILKVLVKVFDRVFKINGLKVKVDKGKMRESVMWNPVGRWSDEWISELKHLGNM